MGLKETLDLIMQYPRIKNISLNTLNHSPLGDGILNIELYPPQPQVQMQSMPLTNDIPPDDVMLFAATEDIDELMEQRKPK